MVRLTACLHSTVGCRGVVQHTMGTSIIRLSGEVLVTSGIHLTLEGAALIFRIMAGLELRPGSAIAALHAFSALLVESSTLKPNRDSA